MSSRNYFFLGIIILLLPYLAWLVLGEDSYVLIHDNLDSEFVFAKALLESGNLFGFDLDGQIDGAMNGLYRSFYRSGFNLTFLILYLFPPFIGYVIHHLLVHLIGYIGLYYLLKHYFSVDNEAVLVAVSLLFGWLSYYHIQYGISIAGQPLLLFAFLNILNSKSKRADWAIITLFPFFSFLPATLPFFVPILVLIGLIHYYHSKKAPILFFVAIIAICTINLLLEFNLVYSTFLSGLTSHRVEWDKFVLETPNITALASGIIGDLKYTQYHAGKLSTVPVMLAMAFPLLLKKKPIRTALLLLGALVGIALWVACSKLLVFGLANQISFLKSFNIERVYFLSPMLWLILLAITLNQYDFSKILQKIVASIVCSLMLAGILSNNTEFTENTKKVLFHQTTSPSFAQFYDTPLFKEAKFVMDSHSTAPYNVICMGFFPNIAQYNGINTLDSYQNNYLLGYKHLFREIIIDELTKEEDLKAYFDYWGSRCYAFSAELGRTYTHGKDSNIAIAPPAYNFEKLLAMNGRFILSSVKINDENSEHLVYLRAITSEDAYWKIYVYKVI